MPSWQCARCTPCTVWTRIEAAELLKGDDLRQRFAALRSEELVSNAAETKRRIEQERQRWGNVIRAAGIEAPEAPSGTDSPVAHMHARRRARRGEHCAAAQSHAWLRQSRTTGSDTMDESTLDKLAIREVIESWAIWRDTGNWERFRTVWHPGAQMTATWFQGSSDEFIARAQASFAKGNASNHTLGGTAIELAGTRAVAQTRMTITSRDTIEGALYDIACTGRFYDLFEKRGGRWAIATRQLTYEKDRADPVFPGEVHQFDRTLLDQFPPGYRFLAYAQTKRGLTVSRTLPCLRGPEVEALYARGARWLAGEAV